ncbi:MAG: L-xylulokinase [Streptosporangiaceae bacterium]|nr:L-xylulokinase [Streptosporangiaceae bacterium]
MPRLLGIDAGSTVTKSVLFDLDGNVLASASRRVALSYPAPHHVERDQDELWDAVVATVRELLQGTGTAGTDVVAVGVTSHGDGVYLVDADGRPTRPGIMSLDTRARSLVQRWESSGVSDRAQDLAGQRPWPSAPGALLAWLWENEPDVVAATRWALPAKDALRQRLTGVFSTEPTEASLSFTNVTTQRYDDAVLDLYGLANLGILLPPVIPCAEISGTVTEEAAAPTGLAAGTPVAAGAHDVDCAALGTGVVAPGTTSVVAGTFSINQVVSTGPRTSSDWCARNFVLDRHWMNMAISPTSATNMEWFAQQMCAADLARGAVAGDAFGFVEHEISAVETTPSEIIYLPFLFGSPLPHDASASFIGLRGWHTRGDLLRAVMEGVAFNHRHHIDALDTAFESTVVRLTGGASKSPRWCQIFADVLDRPVEVTTASEAGALGVSLLAGIATGVYADLADATSRTIRIAARYEPRPHAVETLDRLYARFRALTAALAPVWAS